MITIHRLLWKVCRIMSVELRFVLRVLLRHCNKSEER